MPTTRRSGTRISYQVEDGGHPILLVHGLMGSSDVWRITGWDTALGGYRRVMIDARGHGGSDRPSDPAAYTPEADAADIMAVLDQEGIERAAACGWSMGAAIVLHAAAIYPQRISVAVALGLGSEDLAFADTPLSNVDDQVHAAEAFERHGTREVVEALEAEQRPEWVPMIARADGSAIGARLRGTAVAPRLAIALKDLHQPLLLVWAAAEVPPSPLPLPDHAEVLVIPGEDHVGALGRIDIILPAMERLLASSRSRTGQ